MNGLDETLRFRITAEMKKELEDAAEKRQLKVGQLSRSILAMWLRFYRTKEEQEQIFISVGPSLAELQEKRLKGK